MLNISALKTATQKTSQKQLQDAIYLLSLINASIMTEPRLKSRIGNSPMIHQGLLVWGVAKKDDMLVIGLTINRVSYNIFGGNLSIFSCSEEGVAEAVWHDLDGLFDNCLSLMYPALLDRLEKLLLEMH